MRPFTKTLTIGLTGTTRSGKTVFLTSLISHLLNHDPKTFDLGKAKLFKVSHPVKSLRGTPSGGELTLFPQRNSLGSDDVQAVKGFAKFEYGRWRRCLAEGVWPEKTAQMHQCRLRLARSDHRRLLDLRFIDWPGERLADVDIAWFDYADWSDRRLEKTGTDHRLDGARQAYMARIETDSATQADAVSAHKELLLEVFKHYRPFMAPSTFILSEDGREVRPDENGVSREQLSGLPGREFAPLTAKARGKRPDFARVFGRHFEDYKKKIVLPLFESIAQCDAIIYLIDVFKILSCDHGRYNDTKAFLSALLDYCRPERGVFGKFADKVLPRFLRHNSLKKVAVVAAKADLVPAHPFPSRDQLQGLAKNLARSCDNGRVKTLTNACSAVISTRPGNSTADLGGRPTWEKVDGQNVPRGLEREEVSFSVPDLPEKWPESWKPGDYLFPEVWPVRLPGRCDAVPRQIGLNDVFRFIIGNEARDGGQAP